jgi:hypothetical protein
MIDLVTAGFIFTNMHMVFSNFTFVTVYLEEKCHS